MSAAFSVQPATPVERGDAFRLAFRFLPERERESRVSHALVLLHRGELEADGLLVARGSGSVLGAMICTPTPGAGGLLWPPQTVDDFDPRPVEDALIDAGCTWLKRRGVKLAQALLPPEDTARGAALLRNGFTHTTTLWYLRHTLEMSAVLLGRGERLCYRPYLSDPAVFHDTLLRTYEGTADCPEVSGVRGIDEIIAGHRAQGEYNPERWWLALRDGRPVGVMILVPLTEGDSWEVSYVGIVPEARRRGFGGEMVRKALLEARVAGAASVTLSVDLRNRPAWELYRRLGFEPFDQREVLLAIWKPPRLSDASEKR